MKANWLLFRVPKLGQRDRKNCKRISDRSHRVNLDSEILEIIDASDRAASVYGGIPTATRAIPETADRPPPDEPPISKKATEQSRSDSFGVSPHWSPSVQNLLDRPPAAFPRQVMLGGIAFVLI
ncbi:MAG: hypothetical protein D6728_10245 [Cyanobacteria bacterium J055]|nr:MAG: hypothetical protein D6728_10245 [Cyanobacteria bacterium J055]